LGKSKLEIAFNYKFIEDVLGSIDGEVIIVRLNNESSPAVFLDPENKNFLHLIMPVKV
jgi:DNA polymerase-3 subunit beta